MVKNPASRNGWLFQLYELFFFSRGAAWVVCRSRCKSIPFLYSLFVILYSERLRHALLNPHWK